MASVSFAFVNPSGEWPWTGDAVTFQARPVSVLEEVDPGSIVVEIDGAPLDVDAVSLGDGSYDVSCPWWSVWGAEHTLTIEAATVESPGDPGTTSIDFDTIELAAEGIRGAGGALAPSSTQARLAGAIARPSGDVRLGGGITGATPYNAMPVALVAVIVTALGAYEYAFVALEGWIAIFEQYDCMSSIEPGEYEGRDVSASIDAGDLAAAETALASSIEVLGTDGFDASSSIEPILQSIEDVASSIEPGPRAAHEVGASIEIHGAEADGLIVVVSPSVALAAIYLEGE